VKKCFKFSSYFSANFVNFFEEIKGKASFEAGETFAVLVWLTRETNDVESVWCGRRMSSSHDSTRDVVLKDGRDCFK